MLTLTGSASAIAGTSTLRLVGTFTARTGIVYRSSVNLPLTVSLSVAKKLRARPVQVHPKS
jgi:hypothetical protein